jgi:hypothetical protein
MDTAGARVLAVRLRAGVPLGSLIAIERASLESGIAPGDIGTVVDVTETGVLVDWETGARSLIDPEAVSYRALR